MTVMNRWVWLGTLMLLSCGYACSDPGASKAPSVELSLEGGHAVAPPKIPMAPYTLKSHADFDLLEREHLSRMDTGDLVEVYKKLATDADPRSRPEDVLLLQRLAYLYLRADVRGAGMQDAFTIGKRLQEEAPDHPDTLYLGAVVAKSLLPRHPDGSYRLGGGTGWADRSNMMHVDVAERLAQYWKRLLEKAPDYVGPYGQTADEIRRDLEALKAGIKVAKAQGPDGAEAAPPVALEPVGPHDDASKREVQQLLKDFESSTDIKRVSLCQDWDARRRGPTTGGELEAWANLRCGMVLQDGDRALDGLSDLLKVAAHVDPCRWLKEIQGGSEERRSGVLATVSKLGLGPCDVAGAP